MTLDRVIQIRNELQTYIKKQSYKNFFYLKNGNLHFIDGNVSKQLDFYKEVNQECNAYLPSEVFLQSTYKRTENTIFDVCFDVYEENDISVDRFEELQNIVKYIK